MAQHDYVIANGTGAAVRSDLNNGLAAIVTQNSGATEPTTTYAFMRWADTTAGVMKMRNSANSAWITLYQLDGEWTNIAFENGTAAAPSIYFKDSGTDTGFYSPGANQVGISTGGTAALVIDSSQRVGLGTSTVDELLHLKGGSAASTTVKVESTATASERSSIHFFNGSVSRGRVGGSNDFDGLTLDSSTTESAAAIRFRTGGASLTTKMTLTSGGSLGIGSTAPTTTLDVAGNARLHNSTSNTNRKLEMRSTQGYSSFIQFTEDNIADRWSFGIANGDGSLIFKTGADFTGTEALRIDGSRRLLVGTSSARANFYNSTLTAGLQVEGTGGAASRAAISVINNDVGDNPAYVVLGRSRTASIGSNTALQNGDWIGILSFQGNDGTEFVEAARIDGIVDGTPGSNDMPGRLVFSTTADGASSPTERMRIKSNGEVQINTTSTPIGFNNQKLSVVGPSAFQNANNVPVGINRTGDDGDLILFYQDTLLEGSITVSGSTVSYNGAHLSRWSQLPGGAVREEILRGSVLSNIDEMCGWGEEANEQLNRMKVSDIEGDPNVAGVFQGWDDDDDTYTDDFYCAMTGDFIIRIAEGVTVQRGDLLMSAGDGTAKPQDDDIIRSKTVAKVTSTHITCTYDDGSYCVPCVLMAC